MKVSGFREQIFLDINLCICRMDVPAGVEVLCDCILESFSKCWKDFSLVTLWLRGFRNGTSKKGNIYSNMKLHFLAIPPQFASWSSVHVLHSCASPKAILLIHFAYATGLSTLRKNPHLIQMFFSDAPCPHYFLWDQPFTNYSLSPTRACSLHKHHNKHILKNLPLCSIKQSKSSEPRKS